MVLVLACCCSAQLLTCFSAPITNCLLAMATNPPRRVKRASVQDIYNTCSVWGNCPPDVKNKVESTTVADWILKLGSLFTYFGGLGIGTGKGGGGRFGYTPVGGSQGGRGPTVVRPPVGAPEAIAPDVIAGTSIDATEPSVITLTDAPGDPNVIDVPGAENPVTVTTTSHDPPTVTVEADTEISRVTITDSTHNNPTFDPTLSTVSTGNAGAVTVESGVNTSLVGIDIDTPAILDVSESIELQTFNRARGDTFDTDIVQETEFTASTPIDRPPVRPQGRGRGPGGRVSYTNRRYVQVEVQNPLFLSHPESLVIPGYEVSNADTTLTFPSETGPALDPDFQDIIRLSSPHTTRVRSGRIQVSRLGQESSMATRQGTIIGPQKHFYFDVSSISNAEPSLELQVFSHTPEDGILLEDPNDALDIISLTESLPSMYSESDLLDTEENFGDHMHLVLNSGRRRPVQFIPIEHPFTTKPYNAISIDYTQNSDGNLPTGDIIPMTPTDTAGTSYTPLFPAQTPSKYIGETSNYWYDPSYFQKKRKKRKFSVAFADVSLASQ